MSAILICNGCGATKPEPTGDPSDLYPAEHCARPECPPWHCGDCDRTVTMADQMACSCVISLDGMAFADIKAVFARDGGFNLGGAGPPQPRPSEDADGRSLPGRDRTGRYRQ